MLASATPFLLCPYESAHFCYLSFSYGVRAIGVRATQHFWWVSWINPLADAKHPASREGLSICNTRRCSLTCLDYVTFAMFTFPPDRTPRVWRGDAHRGWNSKNDCLGPVGLLMQTQVKAPGGPHRDRPVVPELGWSFQGFCFLAWRVNTSRFQICVFTFVGREC